MEVQQGLRWKRHIDHLKKRDPEIETVIATKTTLDDTFTTPPPPTNDTPQNQTESCYPTHLTDSHFKLKV